MRRKCVWRVVSKRSGVDIIEAGFPVASEGDFAAVRAVAAECRETTVAALCRTTEADILRAWEAVEGTARPRLHTFVTTSDIHLEHKLKAQATQGYNVTVDLQRRTVCDASGFEPVFVIDEFRRYCLLEGLDDIALTLRYETQIGAFENARAHWQQTFIAS